MTRYLVTLDTPAGMAELEVPTTLGPCAAARRAVVCAAASAWGDLPDIACVSSVNLSDDADAFRPTTPATLVDIPRHITPR